MDDLERQGKNEIEVKKCQSALLSLPSTKVVPVIFLPGIMGSNLRSKKDKKSIWRICTSKLGMVVDAFGWLFTSGNKRKKLLDPKETDSTQYNHG